MVFRTTLERSFRPIAHALHPEFRGAYESMGKNVGFDPQPADTIRRAIESGSPLCVGRLGRTELQIAQRARSKELGKLGWQVIDSLASGDPNFYFRKARQLIEGAGLHPLTEMAEKKFYNTTADALKHVDILASWAPGEAWFASELTNSTLVPLDSLEPFRSTTPWSQALAGKRVLVIHPFEESIRSQYLTHGDKLFQGRGVLPEFDLVTFRPAQAYFGEVRDADEWFQKLEDMTHTVGTLSFDIAIIGAGPFGLPLGSEIKKMGKQAVVMGGATQLLFGILGGRWSTDPAIQSLRNDLWVHPLASETPSRAKHIERSAYW